MQTVKCSDIRIVIKTRYNPDPKLREEVFHLFPENNYSDRTSESFLSFRRSAKIYVCLKAMPLTYFSRDIVKLYDCVRRYPDAEEMTIRAVTQFGDKLNFWYGFERKEEK